MKTYSALTVCGVVVVAASGLWGLRLSLGQEAAATNAAEKPSPRATKERVIRRGDRGGSGYGEVGGSPYGSAYGMATVKFELRGGPHSIQTIREAAAALSEAEDEDAREQAEEHLGELLDEYFEEDMKRREQELAEVEARVKKLRELMERRREKKQEIIELQVEVLRNEADGLGFFSGEGPQGPHDLWKPNIVDPVIRGLPPGHPVPVAPTAAPAAPALPTAPRSQVPR